MAKNMKTGNMKHQTHKPSTPPPENLALYKAYKKTFDIAEAISPILKEKSYRIRHDIYCVENRYEMPHDDKYETDEYDARAAHFLLIHRDTATPAGTVRVILPEDNHLSNSLPIQKICPHPILKNDYNIQHLCQISRMCMTRYFRRREGDGHLLPSFHPPESKPVKKGNNLIYVRRQIPYAPLGLFQAAFETALNAGILNCVMMVETDQLSNFKQLGISYKILDKHRKYHGDRQPVIFNVKTVLDNMLIDNPDSWQVIADRGRLHHIANHIYETLWEDSLFHTHH